MQAVHGHQVYVWILPVIKTVFPRAGSCSASRWVFRHGRNHHPFLTAFSPTSTTPQRVTKMSRNTCGAMLEAVRAGSLCKGRTQVKGMQARTRTLYRERPSEQESTDAEHVHLLLLGIYGSHCSGKPTWALESEVFRPLCPLALASEHWT